MKTINGLKAIDVLCWFSDRVVVARPLDKVLKLISSCSSIENFVNDVLFLVIDYYWRWGGVPLSRKGVVSGWAEKGDVLHWVHLDVAGEFELVCSVEDDFQNFKGAYASMVQLSARAFRGGVFRVKPYLISLFEGRCRCSVFVRVLSVAGLSVGHFYLQVVMDFC